MNKLILVLVVFLFSCNNSSSPPQVVEVNNYAGVYYKVPYQIVEVDSCEYILFSTNQSSWGGHRARCKYCAQRNNKPCK